MPYLSTDILQDAYRTFDARIGPLRMNDFPETYFALPTDALILKKKLGLINYFDIFIF